MIENLKHAARNHQVAWIGGGEFSPRELADAARRLEAADDLLAALKDIVGQETPNKWGYDAAYVAMDEAWRARARAAIAKFTGSQA